MPAWHALRSVLLAVTLGWCLLAGAEPVPVLVPVPPLSARVIDQTATLSREQTQTLEQTLQAFETRKGSQLAVLIVPSTGEETIEQYALRVAEQWKLGRQNVDDGALLLVAKDDRTLRIEVGYGLEGALNDATSKRIISEIIVPRFRQGDFYGGIAAGVERMIGVVDGEPLPEPKRRAPASAGAALSQFAPVIIVLVFVVGGVLRMLLGRLPAAIVTGSGVAVFAWLLLGAITVALIAGLIAFFFTLLGRMGRHGGWHSGGGWSGGRGGGFGGGFGGGGGGFGGGGASGRW